MADARCQHLTWASTGSAGHSSVTTRSSVTTESAGRRPGSAGRATIPAIVPGRYDASDGEKRTEVGSCLLPVSIMSRFPTADGERLLAFYLALGFTVIDAEAWRSGKYPIFSIACGDNKINVHPEGFTANLRGPTAVPGCGDLCFVWQGRSGLPAEDARRRRGGGHPRSRRPGRWPGRRIGPGVSVYVRDPDDNLVEFICYDEPAVGPDLLTWRAIVTAVPPPLQAGDLLVGHLGEVVIELPDRHKRRRDGGRRPRGRRRCSSPRWPSGATGTASTTWRAARRRITSIAARAVYPVARPSSTTMTVRPSTATRARSPRSS